MITCAHSDCGYQVGWTHRGSDDNVRIEPPEGEFFDIVADMFTTVKATRFHGDENERKVLGCPKCNRIFMSPEKEEYADD